jgi:hypothetical protein
VLTSHSSGTLRCSVRLIPALGVCLLGSSSVQVFGLRVDVLHFASAGSSLRFSASHQVSRRGVCGTYFLHGMLQLAMSCSGRKSLTTHSSGTLRCSVRLIQALGSRAFFFCCCIVCITFWLCAALLRAGLRFCFSHARSFHASRAHWRISHLRARSHARFWQHHFHRQPFVRGAQATTASALPGIQSSSIVLASRWAACCCLTSRPSGRLSRRLTQALGFACCAVRWFDFVGQNVDV